MFCCKCNNFFYHCCILLFSYSLFIYVSPAQTFFITDSFTLCLISVQAVSVHGSVTGIQILQPVYPVITTLPQWLPRSVLRQSQPVPAGRLSAVFLHDSAHPAESVCWPMRYFRIPAYSSGIFPMAAADAC